MYCSKQMVALATALTVAAGAIMADDETYAVGIIDYDDCDTIAVEDYELVDSIVDSIDVEIDSTAVDYDESVADSLYKCMLDSCYRAGDEECVNSVANFYAYFDDAENYILANERLAKMGNNGGRYITAYYLATDHEFDKADSICRLVEDSGALYATALRDFISFTQKKYDDAVASRKILSTNPTDTAANYRMGEYYYFDQSEGDIDEAIFYYLRAAQMGHPKAAAMTGSIYFNKLPEQDQDFVNSEKWFRKAAELGSPFGNFLMGVIYDEGVIVPRDQAKSLEYYQRAAALNQPNALYNLGTGYLYKRLFGERDVNLGLELIKKAHKAGHPGAAKACGMAYSDTDYGVLNPDSARYYLEEAVKNGHPVCLKYLAMQSLSGPNPSFEQADSYYRQYKDVITDENTEYEEFRDFAEKYYTKIDSVKAMAATGDADALEILYRIVSYDLGDFYTDNDLRNVLEQACRIDPDTYLIKYVLSLMYGKNPDFEKAMELLRQSDDYEAFSMLEECEKALRLKKDLKAITKKAKKGDAESLYKYGKAIELGLVDGWPNIDWAESMYIEAANRGSINAMQALTRIYSSKGTSFGRQLQYWLEKDEEATGFIP